MRVTTDKEFRIQLEQAETAIKRQQIIQNAGFEFTNEEWEIAKEQILLAFESIQDELSDAELTEVSGDVFGEVIYPLSSYPLEKSIDWDRLLS